MGAVRRACRNSSLPVPSSLLSPYVRTGFIKSTYPTSMGRKKKAEQEVYHVGALTKFISSSLY